MYRVSYRRCSRLHVVNLGSFWTPSPFYGEELPIFGVIFHTWLTAEHAETLGRVPFNDLRVNQEYAKSFRMCLKMLHVISAFVSPSSPNFELVFMTLCNLSVNFPVVYSLFHSEDIRTLVVIASYNYTKIGSLCPPPAL